MADQPTIKGYQSQVSVSKCDRYVQNKWIRNAMTNATKETDDIHFCMNSGCNHMNIIKIPTIQDNQFNK